MVVNLLKEGQEAVEQYQVQIDNGIEDGTFDWLSDIKVNALEDNCCINFHNAVFSQKSATTKCRLIYST